MHKIYWYDFSFLKQKRSVGKKATQFISRRKTFRSERKTYDIFDISKIQLVVYYHAVFWLVELFFCYSPLVAKSAYNLVAKKWLKSSFS